MEQSSRSGVFEEAGRAVAEVARSVGPAVVGLGRGFGLGSGVVVARGRVATCAHNVRGEEVTVRFGDGGAASARRIGSDPDRDVTVLAVETGNVEPVGWEPAEARPGLGSPVVALADPGGRGLRATPGFVSADRRRFRGLRGRQLEIGIEHTAPLPRGSSGGPLVDLSGRLLGLNAVRLEGGLVLAVAADEALHDQVERIGRGEAPGAPRLGVALAPSPVARRMRAAVGLPQRDGLLVRAVEEDSPAAGGGLAAGDLIVAAGGREIDGLERLHGALEAVGADDRLSLRVLRGADERELTVVLDRPAVP